ncbi:MAG TPA: TonB family protein [Opitutaceae bacterium]|jgi:RNA polymerase sigma factor (sigma-70 family)
MPDDQELLRQYAEEKSEKAFQELAGRHLPTVYSVVLRRVGGDMHLAQDVTQRVFADLARKSAVLCRHGAINGWLFVSARYAAAETVRLERRRHERERQSMILNQAQLDEASQSEWESFRPALDQMIGALAPKDRDALLLRFFQGLPFSRIGEILGLSDNAARMRVDRAIGKLRVRLARHGVKSTAAALTLLLAGQTAVALPAGLAGAVTGAASAATAAGGATLLWQFITMNKITAGIACAVAAASIATSIGITKSAGATGALVAVPSPAPTGAPQAPKPAAVPPPETPAPANKAEAPSPAAPKEAAQDTQVFNSSQLDQQPVALVRVSPEVPFEARRSGLKGRVIVDFLIDTNGDVRNATAIEDWPRVFAAAALRAVNKWKFHPGMKGGRAVWSHVRMPVDFR